MSDEKVPIIKNLGPTNIGRIDSICKEYGTRSALLSVVNEFESLQNRLKTMEEKHQTEKQQLIDKYNAEKNLTPFEELLPLKLPSLKSSWKPENGFTVIENTYQEDLKRAEENERIIKHNQDVLDKIIKIMSLVGLKKTVMRYPRANSSTKKPVDAEWYKGIVNSVSSLSGGNSIYLKSYLSVVYQGFKAEQNKFEDQLAEVKIAYEKQELKEKQAKHQAIIIAHACLRYNLDPLKITTQEQLDEALIALGEIPESIMRKIKQEMNF